MANLIKGHTRQSKAKNLSRLKSSGVPRKEAVARTLRKADKARSAQGVRKTTRQRRPKGE